MLKRTLWIVGLLVSVIFIGGCAETALLGAQIAGDIGSAISSYNSKKAEENWNREVNAKFTPWVDTEQSVREIMNKNGKPEEEMLFQNEIPARKILVYYRALKPKDLVRLALFTFDSEKNQFVFVELPSWEKDKYLTWIKNEEFKEYLKSGLYIYILQEMLKNHEKQSRYDLAFEIIKKLIEQKSESNTVNAEANNSVAWFLATCKDPRYRNAEKALEYAQKAVAIKRSASYLDSLAAAYAEKGDFEKAVEVETEAYNLALDKKSGESLESLNSFKELIEVYRSHRTYAQWKYGEKLTSK